MLLWVWDTGAGTSLPAPTARSGAVRRTLSPRTQQHAMPIRMPPCCQAARLPSLQCNGCCCSVPNPRLPGALRELRSQPAQLSFVRTYEAACSTGHGNLPCSAWQRRLFQGTPPTCCSLRKGTVPRADLLQQPALLTPTKGTHSLNRSRSKGRELQELCFFVHKAIWESRRLTKGTERFQRGCAAINRDSCHRSCAHVCREPSTSAPTRMRRWGQPEGKHNPRVLGEPELTCFGCLMPTASSTSPCLGRAAHGCQRALGPSTAPPGLAHLPWPRQPADLPQGCFSFDNSS